MRIALNLLYLIPTELGGGETYAKGLCEGLSGFDGNDEILVYVNQSARDWPLPDTGKFTKIVCSVSGNHRFARYCYEQVVLPLLLRHHRVDVVLSLGNVSPLLAPCCSVVTISDLYFKHFAEHMSFFRWAALAFFVRSSAKMCNQVITVSEFSKQEICRAYPWAVRKISVIPLATGMDSNVPTSRANPVALHLPSQYFVAFSSGSPHKNLGRLIEAYRDLSESDGIEQELIVVGKPVQNASAVKGVTYTGYLPDETVHMILWKASFLMVPSLYEGFGLPVLEAMAMGVPVASSTAGALPEVAGDAALFFCPTSLPAIRNALARMSTDAALRVSLQKKGFENVKRFSWQKTGMKTREVLRQAALGKSQS